MNHASSTFLLEALRANGESLRALQHLQEQTAILHQRFLEGQAAAQASFHALLAGQQRLVEQAIAGGTMEVPAFPAAPLAPAFAPAPQYAPSVFAPQPQPFAPAPQYAPSVVAPQAQPFAPQLQPMFAPQLQAPAFAPAVPPQLPVMPQAQAPFAPPVQPRAAQVPAPQPQAPAATMPAGPAHAQAVGPAASPAVSERSTHSQAANDLPAAGAPAAVTVLDSRRPVDVKAVLLAVVAEATGYPTEMLELDMDLESDLGIDSIKRVEILSMLSKRVPDAPAVDPEHLGSLRTLRQVLEFVSPGRPGAKAAGAESEAESEAQGAGSNEPLEHRDVVVVRLPHGERKALPASGAFLVTEDDAGVGAALVTSLRRLGADARLASIAGPDADLDDVHALICVGDDRPDAVLSSFRWMQAAAPALRSAGAGALLATVSRRDGAFGRIDPRVGSPGQAGLSGLAKTAAQEWPEVRCRALDVAAEWTPREAAEAIAAELCEAGPREVGLGPAGRVGLALRPHGRARVGRRTMEGGLVVVTGGARGVTAACTIEFARRSRPALLLLGRSPLPGPEAPWLADTRDEAAIKKALLEHGFPGERPTPRALGDACRRVQAEREVRTTLAALEAAGAKVIYRSVDARDRDQVAAAIDEARAAFGPVRGVVHGAGVLRDKRIEEKSAADFDEVWSTKVDALEVLLGAVGADDLAFLALFASVTGRFGRRGQCDYAAANEALVAMALREAAARPGCNAIAFDWGPWEGGMVTPGLRREFEKEGIGLIPLQAGAALFAESVLGAPHGAAERVIGAGFPSGEAPVEAHDVLLAFHRIDPRIDRYLDDHRLAGQPVLPVAMMTELFASAARAATGADVLSVEEFRLFKGVVLDQDAARLGVWCAGESTHADGRRLDLELREADRVHARAAVILGARTPSPTSVASPHTDAASLGPREAGAPPDGEGANAPGARETGVRPERANGARPSGDVAAIYRERLLFHGPRFHAIDAIDHIDDHEVVATLRAAPTRDAWVEGAPTEPFTVDPLALDGIFQLAVLSCRRLAGAPSLPSRYDRWTQTIDVLPDRVRARLVVRESDENRLVADCELLGDDGALVAKLEGYVCTVSPSLEAAYAEPKADGAKTDAAKKNRRGAARA